MKLPKNFYQNTLNFLEAILGEERYKEDFENLPIPEEDEVEITDDDFNKIYAIFSAVEKRETIVLYPKKYSLVDKETGKVKKRTKQNASQLVKVENPVKTMDTEGTEYRTQLGIEAYSFLLDFIQFKEAQKTEENE